ncbi:hypothetical protein KEHDKFFH_15320 [Marinobacter maroccanus]|uniref:Uncharacterized protein n=1 Tax=Marinobacter maroccanus TaxID=2055143 RepID=A0A2S5Z7I2_9GAMM|nr:hypothetical protein [Marinobacter maroccanus]PPI83333.1 hypothetical protein KEHDKFFH_15320 [Marinobacter maroccanus]
MTSHQFLAFVEDVSASISVADESNEAGKAIELYRKNSGKDPTHLVWLDAIEKTYFESLMWVNTPFDSNSPSGREQRRDHLNSLDPSKLSVFLLAIHEDDNSAFFDELVETAWLEVSIYDSQETNSVPGLQSPDYEQERIDVVWIVFESRVEGDGLAKLRNVFSLGHLAEADFNIHKPIYYQFTPYQHLRIDFFEISGGNETGTIHPANRPREV